MLINNWRWKSNSNRPHPVPSSATSHTPPTPTSFRPPLTISISMTSKYSPESLLPTPSILNSSKPLLSELLAKSTSTELIEVFSSSFIKTKIFYLSKKIPLIFLPANLTPSSTKPTRDISIFYQPCQHTPLTSRLKLTFKASWNNFFLSQTCQCQNSSGKLLVCTVNRVSRSTCAW